MSGATAALASFFSKLSPQPTKCLLPQAEKEKSSHQSPHFLCVRNKAKNDSADTDRQLTRTAETRISLPVHYRILPRDIRRTYCVDSVVSLGTQAFSVYAVRYFHAHAQNVIVILRVRVKITDRINGEGLGSGLASCGLTPVDLSPKHTLQ